jgi:hypothetical protein
MRRAPRQLDAAPLGDGADDDLAQVVGQLGVLLGDPQDQHGQLLVARGLFGAGQARPSHHQQRQTGGHDEHAGAGTGPHGVHVPLVHFPEVQARLVGHGD